MKNGLLVWNVILTLVAGYLLFAQFSKKGNASMAGKRITKDSLSVNSPFRIAYFEMDSVQANTQLVKEVQGEIEKVKKNIPASFHSTNLRIVINYRSISKRRKPAP